MWFDEDDDDDSIKTYKSWMISYEMFSMMCQDCCNEFWMRWNEANKCKLLRNDNGNKRNVEIFTKICWMSCVYKERNTSDSIMKSCKLTNYG